MSWSIVLRCLLVTCLLFGGCSGGGTNQCADESNCDALSPQLVFLASDIGVLTPTFDPEVHEYKLALHRLESSAEVIVQAGDELEVSIDGDERPQTTTLLVERDAPGTHDIVVRSAAGERATYSLTVTSQDRRGIVETRKDVENFGYSVDIDGDLMVVGARYDSSHVHAAGSVYVYRYREGEWELEANLHADDPSETDFFGTTVAASGEYIIVGAPETDAPATGEKDAGAAYIFSHENGEWTRTAKLVASNKSGGRSGDFFGWRVAIHGDVAVVGSLGESADNEPHQDYGMAYVYRRNGSEWLEEAQLSPRQKSGSPFFSESIAIEDDTLVVTAPGDDTLAADAGAAYVYRYTNQAWEISAGIRRDDPTEADFFGASVAISHGRVVVGAVQGGARNDVAKNGAVFVFQVVGGRWKQTARLLLEHDPASDRFGASVGISGDVIVVGAPNNSPQDVALSGSAHVYKINENEWKSVAELSAAFPQVKAGFGHAVGIEGTKIAIGTDVLDRARIDTF